MTLVWRYPAPTQRLVGMGITYLVRGEVSSQGGPQSLSFMLVESERALRNPAWGRVPTRDGTVRSPSGAHLHWIEGNCKKTWKWYSTSLRPWRNPARHFTYRVDASPPAHADWPELVVTVIASRKDRILGIAATVSGAALIASAIAGAASSPVVSAIGAGADVLLDVAARQFRHKQRLEAQMSTVDDSAEFFDFHSDQMAQSDSSPDLSDESLAPSTDGPALGEIRSIVTDAKEQIEAHSNEAQRIALEWQADGVPPEALQLWSRTELPTADLQRSITSGDAHEILRAVGGLVDALEREFQRSIEPPDDIPDPFQL